MDPYNEGDGNSRVGDNDDKCVNVGDNDMIENLNDAEANRMRDNIARTMWASFRQNYIDFLLMISSPSSFLALLFFSPLLPLHGVTAVELEAYLPVTISR